MMVDRTRRTQLPVPLVAPHLPDIISHAAGRPTAPARPRPRAPARARPAGEGRAGFAARPRRLLVGLLFALVAVAAGQEVETSDVDVTSGGQAYASYLAAPGTPGPHPAVVLLHSFNGLEEGYRTLVDAMAAEGFVVLALGWQTFERSPADEVVMQLVADGVAYLGTRDDVDPAGVGLTGFCAGGRYTMLLLPQVEGLAAGVAWYGFPYGGDTQPASLVADLAAPLLIIHGTADEASAVGDIYRYAGELDAAGKSFELKVYQGEPHGFMLQDGQLRTDPVATDAFREMIEYFRRMLG